MSIIKRMIGEYPPKETRAESNETVNREKRYRQILDILDGNEMTAKEVAVEMCRRGYVPTSERNYAAPRLTELQQKGRVEAIGKKKCQYTNKTVAVYSVREAVTGEQ
jgi:hypothetical protein